MTIFHAGLPEVIVYSEAQSCVSGLIHSSNFPLGIMANNDINPQVEVIELNKGDRVLVYSDGVIEARDLAGEQFGQQRLFSVLEKKLPADTILDNISREIRRFRGAGTQSDDVTMLEINADANRNLQSATDTCLHTVIQHPDNWQLHYHLLPDDLRQANPVSVVTRQISAMKGLNRHRENIFVILTELYNNALDHGVLLLESAMKADAHGFSRFLQERQRRLNSLQAGFVDVTISHRIVSGSGGELMIRVADSGNGFDYQADQPAGKDKQKLSGRGIALARSLCKSLVYEGSGNVVTAVYSWAISP